MEKLKTASLGCNLRNIRYAKIKKTRNNELQRW
jgi:hypothetical protein